MDNPINTVQSKENCKMPTIEPSTKFLNEVDIKKKENYKDNAVNSAESPQSLILSLILQGLFILLT